MPGYQKTKSGKMAKTWIILVTFMLNVKKSGTSKTKAKSTITKKAYKNMLSGFKK